MRGGLVGGLGAGPCGVAAWQRTTRRDPAHKEPAMNSGSGRSGRRRFRQKIAPDIIAGDFGLGHGEPRRDEAGRRWSTGKTLGNAQNGHRAGLAVGNGRLLVRTAGHPIRHGGDVPHFGHGCMTRTSGARRCHHRGGKKAHDRENREQARGERPELHACSFSHPVPQQKPWAFTFAPVGGWPPSPPTTPVTLP
jgi:hypothetical protein